MRDLTENIESQFISLRDKTLDLLNVVPEDILFLAVPLKNEFFRMTIGECVLRSAAASEQAFGGLMTRLWDDPFEWTLPESLSDREKVREYINEVDIQRTRCFLFINDDADLLKVIPAPEEMHSVAQVLLDALSRSNFLLGRANMLFHLNN